MLQSHSFTKLVFSDTMRRQKFSCAHLFVDSGYRCFPSMCQCLTLQTSETDLTCNQFGTAVKLLM